MGLDAAIEGSIGTAVSDLLLDGARWSLCCPSCRGIDGLVA